MGLYREESEGTAAKHGCSEAGHDGLRLYVKIPIHLVGTPATDEANAVAVDAGAEEGHGAASPS